VCSCPDHVFPTAFGASQVFPAQANNAYIFPAVGFAAVITRCSTIPDTVLLEAAEALGAMSIVVPVCSCPDHVLFTAFGASQEFPAQANNAYIFPAVGFAAVITRCSTIPDTVFLEAAEALGAMSSPQQLAQGRLFPPLSQIRETCERLTAHLAQFMVKTGLGRVPEGVGLRGGPPRDVQGWLGVVRERCFAPGSAGAAAAAADGAGDGSSGQQHQQQQGARQLVVARSRL
jgi:malic enzyme